MASREPFHQETRESDATRQGRELGGGKPPDYRAACGLDWLDELAAGGGIQSKLIGTPGIVEKLVEILNQRAGIRGLRYHRFGDGRYGGRAGADGGCRGRSRRWCRNLAVRRQRVAAA